MGAPLNLPSISQIADSATRATFNALIQALSSGSGGSVSTGPGGSNTQVQFNDAGVLAGNAGMVFTKATGSFALSVNYAGPQVLTVSNTSNNAAAQAAMAFFVGTDGLQFVQNQDSVGGAANISTATAKPMTFGTNASVTDLTINASHVLGIGTASPNVRLGQLLDIAVSANYGGMSLSSWTTTGAQSPILDFKKSGSASIGTHTLVANGDNVGNIFFQASDGAVFRNVAGISAYVDGVPGSSDMPGRLVFFTTPDGSTTATERLRIDNAGDVILAASEYLNWGATGGTSGYGLRDNAGTIECKASGGSWAAIGTGGAGTVTHTAGNLTANEVVIGNAGADLKTLGSLGTKAYGLITDAAGAPTWQDVGGLSVVLYGAVGNGSTDDAAAIQSAVTAGNAYFPPGTYLCKTTILIPSNRKIFGSGNASVIKFDNTFVGTAVAWQTGGGNVYLGFANSNYVASGANAGIEISSLAFLTTSSVTGTSGFHCIHMRNTTNWKIHHNSFDGGNGAGDAVSGTLGVDFQISNNRAVGFTNACYDVWDAPTYGVISGNVGHTYIGGAGIFVNGMTTNGSVAAGFNVAVTGNTIVAGGGAANGQGIYIAGLPGGSTVKFCTVSGNTVTSNGSNTFITGIDIREGGNHSISGNTVSGAHTDGIFCTSDYNAFSGNTITGAGTAVNTSGNYGMYSGNVIQGSTTAAFTDTGTGNKDTTNSSANTLNIVHA